MGVKQQAYHPTVHEQLMALHTVLILKSGSCTAVPDGPKNKPLQNHQ